MVHVLIFEKICGLNSPIEEAVNCVWSWLGVLSTSECSQLDAPCSCNKNGEALFTYLCLFPLSFGFTGMQKEKKKQPKTKHMFSCSINLFLNPHSVISVSHYGIITI